MKSSLSAWQSGGSDEDGRSGGTVQHPSGKVATFLPVPLALNPPNRKERTRVMVLGFFFCVRRARAHAHSHKRDGELDGLVKRGIKHI